MPNVEIPVPFAAQAPCHPLPLACLQARLVGLTGCDCFRLFWSEGLGNRLGPPLGLAVLAGPFVFEASIQEARPRGSVETCWLASCEACGGSWKS